MTVNSSKKLMKTLRPLMFISQLTGTIFPPDVYKKRKRLIITYRAIILSLITLAFVREIPTMMFWSRNLTGVHGMLAFIETRLRWFVVFTNFLLTTFNNASINKSLIKLMNSPIILRQKEYNSILQYEILIMAFTTLLMTAYMTLGHDVLWLNPYYAWYTSTIYMVTEFYIGFPNLQFITFLIAIKKYFKALNENLKKCDFTLATATKRDSFAFFSINGHKEDNIAEIVKYRQIHMKLTSACWKTNQSFNLQVSSDNELLNIKESKKVQYDIIITNPPYVDAEDMSNLPGEYRYEPELGLVSGIDGLKLTRRILACASDYLAEGGILICEVGNSMVHLIEQYPDVPFTWLEFNSGGNGVFMLSKAQFILLFLVLSLVEVTYSLRAISIYSIKSSKSDTNNWKSKPTLEALLICAWGGYYLWSILQIIFSCEITIVESNRTSGVVHELLNKVQDKEIQDQLQTFSLQLMNSKVFFSAGKFVTLNFTLLNSIIGTITTYIVIIMTFSD